MVVCGVVVCGAVVCGVKWWRVNGGCQGAGKVAPEDPRQCGNEAASDETATAKAAAAARDSDGGSDGGGEGERQRTAAGTATMDDIGSGGGTATWDGGNLPVSTRGITGRHGQLYTPRSAGTKSSRCTKRTPTAMRG